MAEESTIDIICSPGATFQIMRARGKLYTGYVRVFHRGKHFVETYFQGLIAAHYITDISDFQDSGHKIIIYHSKRHVPDHNFSVWSVDDCLIWQRMGCGSLKPSNHSANFPFPESGVMVNPKMILEATLRYRTQFPPFSDKELSKLRQMHPDEVSQL